jgi:hypothetical protein
MGGNAMCERCEEIEKAIERYRRFAKQIPDHDFNDRAMQTIAELEAEKATLHPE